MRTIEVTFYDKATGAIWGGGSFLPETVEANCPPGHVWRAGYHSGMQHRIDLATGEPAPLLEFDPVIEANAIAGLPEGAVAAVEGVEIKARDGAARMQAAYADTVAVTLSAPAYAAAEVQIEVDPAANHKGARWLKQNYAGLRAKAYPTDREQIGALVKAVQALAAGEDVPADALDVLAQVDAVKAAIPKTPS